MSNRKNDHIQLAIQSGIPAIAQDLRFDYDPIIAAHPSEKDIWSVQWGKYALNYPIWISSMTGGAEFAKEININLAKLCSDFKLGMGLGSCRKIIEKPESIPDFQVRKHIGSQPLFANLGIAQCEQWLNSGQQKFIQQIIEITEADGLILHINPLQEWMQPEGDKIIEPPMNTIKRMLDQFSLPIIVKEVGQGMSKSALLELSKLPLAGIEFGAFGGTNFSLLEMIRAQDSSKSVYEPICNIGHTAEEMVQYMNQIKTEETNINCEQIIISGGIKNFLDMYYLLCQTNSNAIVGLASSLLKPALESYESLKQYFTLQIQGLLLAKSYLKLRNQ
ncbi:MAG: type 2 isopentenyl-diphosphate Delta-isomerase [Saprospiraceae bacterium]|nr:type 2 isopentenyl-diphosphate Delta-isomerase [Saprospiraceae bacterium]